MNFSCNRIETISLKTFKIPTELITPPINDVVSQAEAYQYTPFTFLA
jgi:hypothetical protein